MLPKARAMYEAICRQSSCVSCSFATARPVRPATMPSCCPFSSSPTTVDRSTESERVMTGEVENWAKAVRAVGGLRSESVASR